MPILRYEQKPTFRDISGRFARATDELIEGHREFVRIEGRRYVGIAQRRAPKKSGDFARGIRFRTTAGVNSVGFTASVPQPLGDWIIKGTPPHEIRPKGTGYPLRFEIGGRVIYAYRVFHPGTKPNPFIREAYEEWLPGAESTFRRISTRWVTTVSG